MRTAEPAPFLPTVNRLTMEAREAMAAELFGLDAVRSAIVRAAGLGQERIFLRPKIPVNLRGTAAAVALVEYLTGAGITHFWQTYSVDTGERQEVAIELEISWLNPDERHGRTYVGNADV